MPHPLPPQDFTERSLPLVRVSDALFRLHNINFPPLHFVRSARYRFDAPNGSYGVLYTGSDVHGAFIETFGHATGVGVVSYGELRRRGLAKVELRRPLRLVDLTGPGLARIGADNDLCSGDYLTAQRWSAAMHAHRDGPDGILYRARHDPSRTAAALFDRVAEHLTAVSLGTLADAQHASLLAELLDTYGFGLVASS
jgi:hypothetical protein